MAKSAPDPLDALYAAPLADFVATRNRLATELRKGGDKQAAAAAKSAGKPSVSAWAVNQAVRRSPQGLRRLLEASDDLQEAQLKASGGEARQRYQEAVAEHRQAVDALAAEAEQALADAGQKVSPDVRERIAGNLRWGPQSEAGRALLEAGRLIKDVGPQDFGALARLAVGARADDQRAGGKVIPLRPPPAAAPKPGAASKDDAASSRAARAAEAEREREVARRRRERLSELRAQLRLRQQEAERASKRRDKAVSERERAKARLTELEAALAEAKASLGAAVEEERKRNGELGRAQQALEWATAAVAELDEE